MFGVALIILLLILGVIWFRKPKQREDVVEEAKDELKDALAKAEAHKIKQQTKEIEESIK